MGGERALTESDISSSPLAEILPFKLKKKQNKNENPYANFYSYREDNASF